MKYAILFAFAAFAFLAQAEAKTEISEIPDIHDRGAVTDYLKAKLAAAKEKLEKMLSKAQDALKAKIDEVKKKAEHLIEKLKQAADKIKDKVVETANNILNKLETSVAESIPEKSHNIEGISECMIMKDNFRQAVLAVIANTSSCINNKIEEAQSYVTDIHTWTTKAMDVIKEVKEQGLECTRDVSGIKEIAAAIGCVAKTSAKGTMSIGKTVPAVMLKVARLTNEMATLPLSLSLCMPTKALITLGQQVQPVIVSVKDCIKEKIEESQAPKESSEEMSQTEQTIEEESPEEVVEEESHNEVVEEEHTEVQSNFHYQAPAKSIPVKVQM